MAVSKHLWDFNLPTGHLYLDVVIRLNLLLLCFSSQGMCPLCLSITKDGHRSSPLSLSLPLYPHIQSITKPRWNYYLPNHSEFNPLLSSLSPPCWYHYLSHKWLLNPNCLLSLLSFSLSRYSVYSLHCSQDVISEVCVWSWLTKAIEWFLIALRSSWNIFYSCLHLLAPTCFSSLTSSLPTTPPPSMPAFHTDSET